MDEKDKETRDRRKALVLFSGGLDSVLAAELLRRCGVGVVAITFTSPFFGSDKANKAAAERGLDLEVADITARFLETLKNPRYGYGKNLNPCIDCHALMLREAGRFMEEQGADFLFTGEVLGQRAMSQRREALGKVEKLAGYPGRILRPLSARLLPPTLVETEGRVDRERLLDLQGRSRKPQMALAEAYGITDYPQPGGGCILTKEGFGNKLAKLLELFPDPGAREVELLKWGRHFLLPQGGLCILGRNQADNRRLESLAVGSDILLRSGSHPGPIGLLLPAARFEEDRELAERAVIAYSDTPLASRGDVTWRYGDHQGTSTHINPGKEFLKHYQL